MDRQRSSAFSFSFFFSFFIYFFIYLQKTSFASDFFSMWFLLKNYVSLKNQTNPNETKKYFPAVKLFRFLCSFLSQKTQNKIIKRNLLSQNTKPNKNKTKKNRFLRYEKIIKKHSCTSKNFLFPVIFFFFMFLHQALPRWGKKKIKSNFFKTLI